MSAASRTLRRQLRALAWVTLEEVALDAVAEDGRLVARTSARQVAERLGVDPGTAAGALRVLRDRGLLASNVSTGRRAASDCRSTCSVCGRLSIVPHVRLPDLAALVADNPAVDVRSARVDARGTIAGTPTGAEASFPPLCACPGQEDVRLRVGVVVSGAGVASPKGWQVSVPVGLVGERG